MAPPVGVPRVNVTVGLVLPVVAVSVPVMSSVVVPEGKVSGLAVTPL